MSPAGWDIDRRGESFTQFLDRANTLLCIANLDGYFVALSQAWTDLLGSSYEELTSAPFVSFVHPDDVASTIEATSKLGLGEAVVDFTNRYRCSDGSYVYLHWRSSVVDGYIFASAVDVTPTVLKDQEQAAVAALLEKVLSSITDAVVVFDSHGKIGRTNAAASQMWGYTPREFLGMTTEDLLAAEESAGHSERLGRYRSNDRGVLGQPRELVGVAKGGSRFPIELIVNELDADSDLALIATIRDISERKVLEELKDDFVATVSHDLRTPLTSIKGALRLLEGGVAGPIPEQAAELVTMARTNTDRLIKLVNDILDISKIEAGQLIIDVTEVDLAAVIETSIGAVATLVDEAQLSISVVNTVTRPVLADHDRLVQVLINYLSNAVKFSPERTEISIDVSAADGGDGASQRHRSRDRH